jgi:Holliday junction DNA helicase RuvA
VLESIQGRLTSKDPARVVVETGGIGWLVHVPLSDHDALPRVGEDVRLLLHAEVREDGWRLFGFLRNEGREVFRRLLRVQGVGPLTALTVLSGIGVEDLVAAVAAEDVSLLTSVKGVGRKTADRIVAELKEDARKGLVLPSAAGARAKAAEPRGPAADAVRALVALGLESSEARRRVDGLAGAVPANASISDWVRAALRA